MFNPTIDYRIVLAIVSLIFIPAAFLASFFLYKFFGFLNNNVSRGTYLSIVLFFVFIPLLVFALFGKNHDFSVNVTEDSRVAGEETIKVAQVNEEAPIIQQERDVLFEDLGIENKQESQGGNSDSDKSTDPNDLVVILNSLGDKYPILLPYFEEVAKGKNEIKSVKYKNGDLVIKNNQTIRIDRDKVGTENIKNQTILSHDIADGEINSRTIEDQTITNDDIDDNIELIVKNITVTQGLNLGDGDIDMNGNRILNIGDFNTDFTVTGGLILADQLNVLSGGANITGILAVNGGAYIGSNTSNFETLISSDVTTIDPVRWTGYYFDTVLGHDGFARIVYDDDDYGDLKYAQCLNDSCSEKNITTLDTSFSNNSATKLAIEIGSDGFARIAYGSRNNESGLKYVTCQNDDCSSNEIENIDFTFTGNEYRGISSGLILDSSDNPTIAYLKTGAGGGAGGSLMLAKYVGGGSGTGCSETSDWACSEISSQGGKSVTIKKGSDGYPRISDFHYDDNTGYTAVRFIKCNDDTCTSKNIETLYSATYPGWERDTKPAMELGDDGFARITYFHPANYDLMFVRCLDDTCETRNEKVLDNSDYAVGLGSDIALDSSGYPRITHVITDGDTYNKLRLTVCEDEDCDTSTYSDFEGESMNDNCTSIVLTPDDLYRINYFDWDSDLLHYAYQTRRDFESDGNDLYVDGDIAAGGDIMANGSLLIEGGINQYSADPNNLIGALNVVGNINTNGTYQIGGTDIIKLGDRSIFVGINSGFTDTGSSGYRNAALGEDSLYYNQWGGSNVAVGYRALYGQVDSSSDQNTAIGAYALSNNYNGGSNTAIGYYSLRNNYNGYNNTAIGYQALYNNYDGNYNIANGYRSLYSNYSGDYNIASGYQALYSNNSGSYNTATGYQALRANYSGQYNVANGYRALYSNYSGSSNIAAGREALYSNYSGSSNIASGQYALYSNNSGQQNIAIGDEALRYNNSGSYNVANGFRALYSRSNAYGSYNIASGYQSLYNNYSGSHNVANGYNALYNNYSGTQNVANGREALFGTYNSSGSNNIASGYRSLYRNYNGSDNIASGQYSLYNNYSGSYNIGAGYQALYGSGNTSGGYNVATGYQALYTNNSGYYNIASGHSALRSNYSGYYNIASGYQSLYRNYGGSSNVAIGRSALYNNYSGQYNVASGAYALYGSGNASGNYNVASGYNAMHNNNTGSDNIATGRDALYNNYSGSYNIANGYRALYANYSGTQNIASGYLSLYSNYNGNNNIASGQHSLYYNYSGSSNVAIGQQSLYNSTGSGNIGLGFDAANNLTAGNNNIFIGYDIDAPVATGSNQLSIGNLIYATGGFGTGTTVGAGNIGIGTNSPSNFKLEVAGSVGPSADDTYDLGSPANRWRDLYLGPASIHLGVTGDEVVISYDTVNDEINFDKRLNVTASTTNYASISIPTGSAPTTPGAGDLYSNGTDLFFYNGTTWDDLTGGGAAAHDAVTLGTANGLSLSTQQLSLALASTSTTGALSSTDWNTFNNKLTLPTLTSGSVLFSNGSTIAQDNSNLFWDDTSKRLGIGTTTPDTLLEVVDDAATRIYTTAYHDTAAGANGAFFTGRRAGGAEASPVAILADDRIVSFGGTGWDGSAFRVTAGGPRASIEMYAAENWSPTNLGTYMNFQTTANGTQSPATRLTIDQAGNIGIGDETPAALFTVGSGDSFQVNSSGQVVAGAWQGTAIGAQYGGTGINGSSAASGSLLIGNGTGYTLSAMNGDGTIASDGALTLAASIARDSELHDALTIGTANGLSLSTQQLSLALASTSTTGALSNTDWNTFNNKFDLPALTSGSVLFSNGSTIAQDNTNFFWDDTNKRLGLGTNTPSQTLHLKSSNSSLARFEKTGSSSSEGANSGATFAHDTSIGTVGWDWSGSPSDAAASDDTKATAVSVSNEQSYYLKATNFGFNIPAGSIVDGIVVEVEKSDEGTTYDNSVKIVKGGTITGTDKADGVTDWPATDTYVSYGGGSDLWGSTWTASDINSSGFGVGISAIMPGAFARIDHIRITVYYSVPETNWVAGLDSSDDSFKVSNSSDVGTNDYLTVTSGGNIGIGNISPTAHLVVGDDASAGYANGIGDVYIQNDLEVDGSIYGTVNPGFSPGSLVFAGASGLAQDNANLFWDDANNGLAIGSNSAAVGWSLTVDDGIYERVNTDNPAIFIDDTASTTQDTITMSHSTSTKTGNFITANMANFTGSFTGSFLDFSIDSNDVFRVDSSGGTLLYPTSTWGLYIDDTNMAASNGLIELNMVGVNDGLRFSNTVNQRAINFKDTGSTTANTLQFSHNTSTKTGDLVWANMASGSGTFTGDFVDFNVNGVNRFKINSSGQVATGSWQGTLIGSQYGGTGLNTSAATGIPTISSGTWSVSSQGNITGTANQVSVTGGTGAIIGSGVSLSLPQDIATGSSPTFAGATLTGLSMTTTTTPGSPASGDMYSDGTDLFFYNGSTWDDLTEVGSASAGSDYGEMYVYGNSTAQTFETTYAAITAFDTAGDFNNVTVDPTTDDDLTVANAGKYEVKVSLAFSGANSSDWTVAVHVNGTEQTDIAGERKLGTGGDVGSMTLSGILDLSANDVVDIRMKAGTSSTDATIQEANISIHSLDAGSVLAKSGNDIYYNGSFGINTSSFGATSANILAIAGSTAPTASITDGIQLFAVDAAGSHELQVRDEAGNVTTLSPHNFSNIGNGSEELAWAYYSERDGKSINVDMTKAMRLIEKLTGEKLVYLKNLETGELYEETLNYEPNLLTLDELNRQEGIIGELELQTSQNITTLEELQASIDSNLLTIENELTDQNTRLTTLETELLGTDLDLMNTQIDELMNFMLAIETDMFVKLNTLAIGNILLDGKLEATDIETGTLVVKVVDSASATIGTATICPVDTYYNALLETCEIATDIDIDGIDDNSNEIISDGTKTIVKTTSITDNSKVFVTPKSRIKDPLFVVNKTSGESFEVDIDTPVVESIIFDWWIVDEKVSSQ